MSVDEHHLPPPTEDEEFWLFGYGSLIWKPPPHFDRRIPGWVTGYVRRFWQARYSHLPHPPSTLTPEQPSLPFPIPNPPAKIIRDTWTERLDILTKPKPPLIPKSTRGKVPQARNASPLSLSKPIQLPPAPSNPLQHLYGPRLSSLPGPQKSEDHRGTPSAPGRVVTLIDRAHWATLGDAHHAAPARVWGCAYRIARPRVAEVKAYLDIREINGYTIHYTPFHPAPAAADDRRGGGGGDPPTTTTIRTLVYIGTPDNAQFTGPQDVGALAEHIYRSEGPSGLNRDYLWGLERALDELSPESGDDHVSDLSERVRAIAKRVEAQKQGDGSSAPPAVIDGEAHPHHLHEFHRVTSVEESEETEKAD